MIKNIFIKLIVVEESFRLHTRKLAFAFDFAFALKKWTKRMKLMFQLSATLVSFA
jgi:hypothetical protein